MDLRDDREVGSPSTLDTKYPDRERPPASWSRKMPPKPAPRLFQYISNKSRKPPPPPVARDLRIWWVC